MREPYFPELPTQQARLLAAYFEGLARYLIFMADMGEASEVAHKRDRERMDELAKVPELVMAELERGRSVPEAFERLRQRHQVSDQHLRHAATAAKTRLKELTRDRRALLILRLAGRGWTDERIGERVGMHPKSVNRALSRMIRPKKGVSRRAEGRSPDQSTLNSTRERVGPTTDQ